MPRIAPQKHVPYRGGPKKSPLPPKCERRGELAGTRDSRCRNRSGCMGSGRAVVRRRRRGQSLWRGREVEGENTELTFPSSTFLYQSPPTRLRPRRQSLLKCLAPPPSPSSLLRQQERGVRSRKDRGKGKPDGTKFVDRELVLLLLHGCCVESCPHEGGRA